MDVKIPIPQSNSRVSLSSESLAVNPLTVSKADIISFRPCDSESMDNIDNLMAGNERIDVTYVLNLSIPAVHKLWLVLRSQLIPMETLAKIKTAFVAMIPPESEHYQRAVEIRYDFDKVAQVVIQALRPQPSEMVGRQLVEIVRKFISEN